MLVGISSKILVTTNQSVQVGKCACHNLTFYVAHEIKIWGIYLILCE